MNLIDIGAENIALPEWTDRLRDYAGLLLDQLGKANWDLSILLCDDLCIQDLNREYRNKDEPTDVLSFEQNYEYATPEGENRFLAGDIAISLDTLGRNAVAFGVTVDEELKRLVLHGILHLSGLDHEDNNPERPMLAHQEAILREITGGRIV